MSSLVPIGFVIFCLACCGQEAFKVSLENPAQVGGPVWLSVADVGSELRYPFSVQPWDFDCHLVEVRRGGELLTRIAPDVFPMPGEVGHCHVRTLPGESAHAGRIPLHLQYRFPEPGIYEVRYSMRKGVPGRSPVLESRWTPITLHPGTAIERSQWLQNLGASMPGDAVTVLTEFLPSILGVPDQQSLELTAEFLYHPEFIVREYAKNALSYWPAAEAEAKVRDLLGQRGPSDSAVQFLTRTRATLAANGDFVVAAAMPYLHSDSPLLLRGAAIAICSAPLDFIKSDRGIAVLLDLARRDVERGRAINAIVRRRSVADLPELMEMALEQTDHWSMLPVALRRGYGDPVAIPLLETVVARARSTRLRIAAASELIFVGNTAGFAFLVDAIENRRPYRVEMIDFARSSIPELRQSYEAEVLAFAKSRAVAR